MGVMHDTGFGDNHIEWNVVRLRSDTCCACKLVANADRQRAGNQYCQCTVEVTTTVAKPKTLRVESNQREQHDIRGHDLAGDGNRDAVAVDLHGG